MPKYIVTIAETILAGLEIDAESPAKAALAAIVKHKGADPFKSYTYAVDLKEDVENLTPRVFVGDPETRKR